MFDRFTDRNKKIMSCARLAAIRLNHDYIDASHMLLGLIEVRNGVGGNVLTNAGVDLDALRASFEATVAPGSAAVGMGQIPFTPDSKRVLEMSFEEATLLGHNYIGSEHLLLGLLRTEHTDAAEALRAVGVGLEAMRADVREFCGEGPEVDISRDRLRLLLISNSTMHGGGYLAHCSDEIREFLGAQRRVAFVPYALADHDGYEAKAQAAFAALGLELTSVHRGRSPRDVVRDADAVFVGGGNTFRLLNALYQTGLDAAIRLHAGSGRPYIGSSAGTNVAALSIKTTNDMPIVMPPVFTALALVPFQINPHYLDPDPASTHMGETREERLLQFHEENATPVLAIREGCILRVEAKTMELRGTTGARLFRQGQAPEEFMPPCDLSFLLQTPAS